MSIIGSDPPNRRIARLLSNSRAEQKGLHLEPSPAKTPHWLLWSVGIVAILLSFIAFVLWGINGPSTLFDMIVALCI
jgi:hypothetical protein